MSARSSNITFFVIMSMAFMLMSSTKAVFNVLNYGAKTDGATDSTSPFLKAWAAACGSTAAATIYVPKGRFLLKAVVFRGPCKSSITVKVDGTLVAPLDYWALGNSGYWILFIQVNNVTLLGGSLDARAAKFWACRNSGQSCPPGARSITFNWANDITISGLTSINSQLSHIVINSCNNVLVKNVKTYAPDQSPNTDGIHIQGSTGVTISGSTLQTGDDCISIGPGTKNLFMTNIKCGPGHGVSIGSLGWTMTEVGVQNLTLTNSVFIGSDNGVRIKTWARPSNSFVKNVLFANLIMSNVKNPIIIDQDYCPNNAGCPNQSSGVKISGVTYKNIQGTSATQNAVIFECSKSKPCSGIRLQDIKLTYMNKASSSSCTNVGGSSSGVLIPRSCL
ncbi:hypothetical protein SAY86_019055 [Trapa natans]|uniref:Polygalacturonase n=1 Tax=Trapa natans TaxID=22666 RepID=A0AAN7LS48_TRANT|nr:hypothetical protein SAY86_019055 [Trapa natans]